MYGGRGKDTADKTGSDAADVQQKACKQCGCSSEAGKEAALSQVGIPSCQQQARQLPHGNRKLLASCSVKHAMQHIIALADSCILRLAVSWQAEYETAAGHLRPGRLTWGQQQIG